MEQVQADNKTHYKAFIMKRQWFMYMNKQSDQCIRIENPEINQLPIANQ